MQSTPNLFQDDGPSKLMQMTQAKFDAAVSYLDECWQNRVSYEISEDENNLSDQQMFFLMDEIVRLVSQVLQNKNA